MIVQFIRNLMPGFATIRAFVKESYYFVIPDFAWSPQHNIRIKRADGKGFDTMLRAFCESFINQFPAFTTIYSS